jgi:hypothetical protein
MRTQKARNSEKMSGARKASLAVQPSVGSGNAK